jgi:hypothetical protein
MSQRPVYPYGWRALRYRLSPTRWFFDRSVRRGLLGGNRGWIIAFVTVRSLLAIKGAVSRKSEHIAIDRLKPGERILIRTIPVSSAKERKRLLRGE